MNIRPQYSEPRGNRNFVGKKSVHASMISGSNNIAKKSGI